MAIPRNEANSNTLKIFKNEQIKFKERVYHAFNVSLKKVLIFSFSKKFNLNLFHN